MKTWKRRLWMPKEQVKEDTYFTEEKFNALDSFKSMMPGFIPLDDKDMLEKWIFIYRKIWFKNPESRLYGYKQCCKAIAKYWFKHGQHSSPHNDPNVMHAQIMWDNYIKKFIPVRV